MSKPLSNSPFNPVSRGCVPYSATYRHSQTNPIFLVAHFASHYKDNKTSYPCSLTISPHTAKLLTSQESIELSSFVSDASLSDGQPPVLFAHVDESWELLSTESRQAEAEALFEAAKARWGTRDGFIQRGNAMVAQRWNNEVTVFGSLHGDTE